MIIYEYILFPVEMTGYPKTLICLLNIKDFSYKIWLLNSNSEALEHW